MGKGEEVQRVPDSEDIAFERTDGQGGTIFHEFDLAALVRDVGGDAVERIELIDEFTHPKSGRHSLCYRFTFRSISFSDFEREPTRAIFESETRGMQFSRNSSSAWFL